MTTSTLPSLRDGGHSRRPWKILIADDEIDVHLATKMVLRDFMYQGRGVEFIDAFSGEETAELLSQHPDTAVILLDVVMETPDAGLRVIKRIREEISTIVRIILRTGQPGEAPENDVILNYHINDYKAKAELTAEKLFTSIVAALRSYEDIVALETSRRGLMNILDASSSMDFKSRSLFVSGLLMQLGSMLDFLENDMMLIRPGEGGQKDAIIAACGIYVSFIGECPSDVLDAPIVEEIGGVFRARHSRIDNGRSIHLIPLAGYRDVVLYIRQTRALSEVELSLMSIFCHKIVLAYDNYEYVEQARNDKYMEIALLVRFADRSHENPIAYARNLGRLSRAMALRVIDHLLPGDVARRFPEIIEQAAMLADIGNHEVPMDILKKPGPLTSEEAAVIQRHPRMGVALLEEAALAPTGLLFDMTREVVSAHHERFDGTGYPDGLAKTNIPLAARIVAVADSYMALTSRRPWRDALPHGEAVQTIRDSRGEGFDPLVVDAFLECCEMFRSGRSAPAEDIVVTPRLMED